MSLLETFLLKQPILFIFCSNVFVQMLCPFGIWVFCIILLLQFTLTLQLIIVLTIIVLYAGLKSAVAPLFGSISRRGKLALLFFFLLASAVKMSWDFPDHSSLTVGI